MNTRLHLSVLAAVLSLLTSATSILHAQMRTATFPGTSQLIFTPASIVGLIVFFFFSLQCFSTVAVVRKETNNPRL